VRLLEGAFVVEGAKLVSGAFEAGAEVESVYVSSSSAPSVTVAETIRRASELGVRVFELAPGVLERVSETVSPQPVLAVVRTPKASLEQLDEARFVVVCVDVRDPGNAGAVIRAADASGADAMVCCEGTVDPFNPKTVRASAGSVLHLPVVAAPAPTEALGQLGRFGLSRVAAVAHGGTPYTSAELGPRIALVLGNEGAGLPERTWEVLDGSVTVPMAGGAESLNVSMAAAVLCFEVARRRSEVPGRASPAFGGTGSATVTAKTPMTAKAKSKAAVT
jgi:RNA methyltransferase, TrmH family